MDKRPLFCSNYNVHQTLTFIFSFIIYQSDRNQPVNRGKSTSSQLIRLMTSTMLPQTRDAICECLFVLCNEDGKKKKGYILYFCGWRARVLSCVCRYIWLFIFK